MTRAKTLAPALAVAALIAPSAAAAPPTPWTYPAHPPAEPIRASQMETFGLSATLSGHTLDLNDYGAGWALDPTARPDEASAGLGWRSDRSTVILGYRRLGDRPTRPSYEGWGIRSQVDTGVLGFSLVLRSR